MEKEAYDPEIRSSMLSRGSGVPGGEPVVTRTGAKQYTGGKPADGV